MPRKRYDNKTYLVYGDVPQGNWLLNIAMANDYHLYEFVRKNNKELSKMPKTKIINIIKNKARESWSIDDLKKVKSSNVRSKDLKTYLKNFNE